MNDGLVRKGQIWTIMEKVTHTEYMYYTIPYHMNNSLPTRLRALGVMFFSMIYMIGLLYILGCENIFASYLASTSKVSAVLVF
jgi:hypothetical protein